MSSVKPLIRLTEPVELFSESPYTPGTNPNHQKIYKRVAAVLGKAAVASGIYGVARFIQGIAPGVRHHNIVMLANDVCDKLPSLAVAGGAGTLIAAVAVASGWRARHLAITPPPLQIVLERPAVQPSARQPFSPEPLPVRSHRAARTAPSYGDTRFMFEPTAAQPLVSTSIVELVPA